jgi:hypothetical protein
MTNVIITVDTSSVDRSLRRLINGPDGFDLLRFERVLTNQFLATQEMVHVITGSLKGSGRQHSTTRKHEWEGEIAYGGDSTGPINPVKYAVYEMERGWRPSGWDVQGKNFQGVRGGTHDFMDPAFGVSSHEFKHGYVQAIMKFLEGGP